MFSTSSPLTLPPLPARSSHPDLTRVRFRPPQAMSSAASASYTSYSTREDRASLPYVNLQRSSSSTCLYDVLGIPNAASFRDIKSAYRRLARVLHPDVVAVHRKDSSAADFMEIHAAYSILSDPDKRADYDRKLLRRCRPVASVRMASGYTRRNWETDQCW